MSLHLEVVGTPAPQGSKRLVGKNLVEASAKVGPWREAVKWIAIRDGITAPMQGPIRVYICFRFTRPKGHYRNDGRVKASAPAYPIVKPDLDKLVRCTLDALTDAGVWRDDSQVVRVEARKEYTILASGALIIVEPLGVLNETE